MSSRLFEKLLHLKPRVSRTLIIVLSLLHGMALLSVIVTVPADKIVFWLLLVLLVLSFFYYLKRYILLTHPLSVVSVIQTRQGDWSVCLCNGKNIDVDLCDDSYKHPLLVVLNFKTKLGRLSVPLFHDALDGDSHRQLRCRLTLSRPAEKEKLLRR